MSGGCAGVAEGVVTFGQMVKAGRKAKGLTQREVAERFGIDFTYISKIECGASEFSPSDKLIAGFAELYELDSDDLYVAAGKCPPDLLERLRTDRAFVRFVRKVGQVDIAFLRQERSYAVSQSGVPCHD